MKKNILLNRPDSSLFNVANYFSSKWILTFIMIIGISLMGYAQKNKDIIPTIDCIKYTGNGLYQASFGYENPTKKEVTIDENGSIIKSNNGKRVAKGLNKFKPGPNNKVFTKEFSANDYVEWTIISNGNEHTIVVNANGAKCEPDDGFIFPVIGNGKSFDIIGQELTALCDNVVGETPSDLIFQIDTTGNVLVEIVPISGQMANLLLLLQGDLPGSPFDIQSSEFLLDLNDYDNLSAVDVYVAKADLCLLNDYPLIINFARPVYPAIKHSFGDISTGRAISQGDASQGSNVVRESFRLIDTLINVLPVDGTGITIGVMSNSFDTQSASSNLSRATVDVQQGDLPGDDNPNGYLTNVNVLKEYPFEALGKASDEGRAMMHIIHDVAPGAALAFHTGSLSPRNFEVGFKALAVNSDLIVDDITFITEPFFRDGRISESIKAFSTAGGIHFTSAGNFADHGYQSTFSPSSTVPTTNFIDPSSETKAHLFDGIGGSDYLQKFSVVPGTYLIALQWKELVASQDNSEGADNDLDIYIVDDLGRLLVGSNRVNSDFVNSDGSVDGIKGDPTEIIVFRATGTGEANILITSAKGATNVPFRYIAFQSDGLTLMEYDEGTPTISGHAMTEESVTVGAIRYNKTEPESFSSFGGTLSDSITDVGVDFAAPDGVDTNVISIGSKYFSNGVPVDDTPEYPNFFGTSASAPSAAAAVALLQSALPTWYPSDTINGEPIDVIQLFKDNVRDGSLPNDSIQAGKGMIDVNKVFNSLATQTARITSFTIVANADGTVPTAGVDTLKINVIGDFFPPPPSEGEPSPIKFLLDGVELTATVLTNGSIEATIPPFSGNPDLQVETEKKEGSKGNGGKSEPYSFFQDGKAVLTITSEPLTIKFGEEYKSKLTYTLEGLELLADENDAQALERLGFPIIALSTVVDNSDYPDVNNYTVTPNFEGDFPDSDDDGVSDVYDQCPDTPDGATVDENGCSDAQKGVDNFTPATTYIVNFIDGNLAIEKNNLIITPKDVVGATYGEKITVVLEYSGYGTTNDAGDESFGLINDPEAFLAKIKLEHLKDFYNDETTGITPVGLINNFKPGTALDTLGVDRYQDILDMLENGSWISSENTLRNRVEEVPYSGGSYPEDAGYPERVYGSVNTDLGSGFINFNPLDFTAYLDYFDTPDETIENGRVLGVINGRVLGVINGQRLGIMNGRVLGVINGRVLGVINGRAFGVINGRTFGVINSSALGSGTDTNDYNQVFSVIDTSDFSEECAGDGVEPCAITKFYALNLITGVEVTNGVAQYIFPGTFINPMSDNFNITYQKEALTVAKKDLTVSIPNFTIEYGDALTKDRLLAETTVFDGWAYGEDIATYFADDEEPFEFVKEGITYQINELIERGSYAIMLKDLDNYNIVNPVGTLTIDKATLNVTISPDQLIINQGDIPQFTADIDPTGYVYGETEDDVFPAGIQYKFEDEYEFIYYDTSVPGVFTVGIEDPTNYVIVNNEAKLFINPDDASKIRTYADCVKYNPGSDDFTVTYRYENDNDDPVYVAIGADNNLSGIAAATASGTLPTIFMPGSGTFEIRFNGDQLIWSLTTYGSTNKSSVSSSNQSGTGECDGKLDGAYSIGPNPVTSNVNYVLSITNNTIEVSDVFVYNMYGSLVITGPSFNGTIGETKTVNMSDLLLDGLYIVRIVSASKVRTYNIIKQLN